VRVLTSDVDEGLLARIVEVRLDHRRASLGVEPLNERIRCVAVGWVEPRRAASARRHRRLDDEGLGWRFKRRPRSDEPRRHGRDAGAREALEIALVGVPLEQRNRVLDASEGPRPGEELVAPFRVVPCRANEDESERTPLDGLVVPDRRDAVDAVSGESGEEKPVVGLQVRNLSAGRECD
jgi:hypothetical protein